MLKKLFITLFLLSLTLTPVQARNEWLVKPPFGAQIDWGHPFAKNLMACWLVNEGRGKIYNLANLNDNLDIKLSTSWIIGEKGYALNFPDYSYLRGPSNFKYSGTGQVTILQVYSANHSDNDYLVNLGVDVANNMMFTRHFLGVFRLSFWGGPSVDSANINDNKPHHCVAVYDGTKGLIYVDGKFKGQTTAYSSLNITSNPLNVGSYTGLPADQAYMFNGKLYLLYIWGNRALTSSEIQSLYLFPYQFIKSPDSWWYNVVSGVTTSVTQTYTNLRNAILRNSTLR